MTKKITVKDDDKLLNYLLNNDSGYTRNKLKSLLKNDCISINNVVTRQFNDPVLKGDFIKIKSFNDKFALTFEIIYEDVNIIVINKPSGLLSTPFTVDDKETAYDLVSDYILSTKPASDLFVVHRLDQGTSGVLMFAKSEKIQRAYQDSWNELALERSYIAYVEGIISKDKDTIISNLNTSNSAHVYSSHTGKKAITHYEVIERRQNNTILKVIIDTGRQNQIRVHLKELGHPIIGDKKYGAQTNPLKRLGLHADQLVIKNPLSKEVQVFKAKVPQSFKIR